MFFDKDGMFRLDEMVAENANFKKIMADDVVTDAEVIEQSNRVIELYHALEQKLSAEELALVAETITETQVLYAIVKYKELEEFHK